MKMARITYIDTNRKHTEVYLHPMSEPSEPNNPNKYPTFWTVFMLCLTAVAIIYLMADCTKKVGIHKPMQILEMK